MSPGCLVEADILESHHVLSPTSEQCPCPRQALGWCTQRTEGGMS